MIDLKPFRIGQIAYPTQTIPVRFINQPVLTAQDVLQDPPAAPAPGLIEAILESDGTEDLDVPPAP